MVPVDRQEDHAEGRFSVRRSLTKELEILPDETELGVPHEVPPPAAAAAAKSKAHALKSSATRWRQPSHVSVGREGVLTHVIMWNGRE